MNELPEGWIETTIEDISLEMGDAPFGINLKNKDYTDTGVIVVQSKNVQGRTFNWSNRRFVTSEKHQSMPKNHCFVGDLIFPKVGTIGNVGILSPHNDDTSYLLSTNTMRLKVDPNKANQLYVYYFFTWNRTARLIRSMNSSSFLPVFNYTSLKKFPIQLPPVETQEAIANILNSLEMKIELLQEQNGILENIAKTLFKEWFVNFNYPNAAGKMVDSEFGEIPEGWRVTNLKDITCYIGRGIQPAYSENGVIVINQKCIRDGKVSLKESRITDPQKKKITNDKYLQSGDVVICSTGNGTLGRISQVGKIEEKMISDFHVTVARADQSKLPVIFLGYLLKSKQREIEFMAEGSTGQTELPQKKLLALEVILPSYDILEKYDAATTPIFEKICENDKHIEQLEKTRDTLLPKLLNGSLCVQGNEE